MAEKRDYAVICGSSRCIIKGVTRITRKGWLFNHEIALWGEGDLPLAVFRDHHVEAIIAEQEGVAWKDAKA